VGFKVLTAVRIHSEVFCVVTQCSVVIGYQSFGAPCCLYLHYRSPGLLGCDAMLCNNSEDLDLYNGLPLQRKDLDIYLKQFVMTTLQAA